MIAITANTIIAFRLPTSKRFAPKKVSCSYHMTILKNITLAPTKLKKIPKAQAKALALDLLDKVGLKDRANDYPSALSGGQKQRVSIARAIYKDAPIMLLDDCTSALDYETERKIIANVKEQYKDKTVIIATHRATSVTFCDTIIFLEDGKIAEMGSPEELIAKQGKYYEILTTQEKLFNGETEMPSVEKTEV